MTLQINIKLSSSKLEGVEAQIKSTLKNVFISHPFFSGNVSQPSSLTIDTVISLEHRTQIDHCSFQDNGRITLYLGESDICTKQKEGEIVKVNYDQLDTKLENLFAHELSHFIDARLDYSFGYSDSLRPSSENVRRAHFHLWDSYIDGRLGGLAYYSLKERQKEAYDVSGLNKTLVSRAWNGEFKTYELIINEAKKAIKNLTTHPAM